MKLSLFLISLLFLITSCTIDWNDEKDKKIAELEKQIIEINELYLPYQRNPIFDEKLFSALEDTKIIESLTGEVIMGEREFFTYDDCSIYYKKEKVSTLCEIGPKPTKDEFEKYVQNILPKKWTIQNLRFVAPRPSFILYKTDFNSFGEFSKYIGILANKSLYENYANKINDNSYPTNWIGSLGRYEIDIQKVYGSDVLFFKNNGLNLSGLRKIDDESLYPNFIGFNDNIAFIWAGDGYIVALTSPAWIPFILENLQKESSDFSKMISKEDIQKQ